MVPSLGFEADTRDDLSVFGPRFEHLIRWPAEVVALSQELDTPMLVGSEAWIETSIVRDADDPTRARLDRRFTYNSAYLIQGETFQRYDKSFLTPFGETMPYISNWTWLETKLLALGAPGMSFELDSNPEIRLLKLAWGEPPATSSIATPICFEDTVARLCRRMLHGGGIKRADLFVNMSNDGWFGASEGDRKLHAQIARFRCIENRVPMVRSVNTGMSVAIDSAGRLVAAAGGPGYGVARQESWVLAEIRLDSRRTLYSRVGDVWPWTCLGATVIGLILTIGRRKDTIA
jgi:apolipoprotein N-acyltransferase